MKLGAFEVSLQAKGNKRRDLFILRGTAGSSWREGWSWGSTALQLHVADSPGCVFRTADLPRLCAMYQCKYPTNHRSQRDTAVSEEEKIKSRYLLSFFFSFLVAPYSILLCPLPTISVSIRMRRRFTCESDYGSLTVSHSLIHSFVPTEGPGELGSTSIRSCEPVVDLLAGLVGRCMMNDIIVLMYLQLPTQIGTVGGT